MMHRRLHIMLTCIVTSEVCLLCVIHSVQSADSHCAAGQYFDGLEERCIDCSAVCLPDIESDFCANNCPDYAENLAKQRHPIGAAREVTEAAARASDAYNSGRSTMPPAVTADVSSTVVLRLAVACAGITIVAMLLMIPVISCRSCRRQPQDPEKNDDGGPPRCRCCPPLDDVRRQHVERSADRHHHVNVAGANDCDPTDNGIRSPVNFYESTTRDASEPTTSSLDAVSLLSSLHDDVKSPVSWTWSVSASDDRLIIHCTPCPAVVASDSNE